MAGAGWRVWPWFSVGGDGLLGPCGLLAWNQETGWLDHIVFSHLTKNVLGGALVESRVGFFENKSYFNLIGPYMSLKNKCGANDCFCHI